VYGPCAITSAQPRSRQRRATNVAHTAAVSSSYALVQTISTFTAVGVVRTRVYQFALSNTPRALPRTATKKHNRPSPQHAFPTTTTPGPRPHHALHQPRSSHDHLYYEPSSVKTCLVVRKACHPRQASMPSCASSYTTISTMALLRTPCSSQVAYRHSNPAVRMQRICLRSAVSVWADTRPPLMRRAQRECIRSIWDALMYSPTLVLRSAATSKVLRRWRRCAVYGRGATTGVGCPRRPRRPQSANQTPR
jgi:hypothetical protein